MTFVPAGRAMGSTDARAKRKTPAAWPRGFSRSALRQVRPGGLDRVAQARPASQHLAADGRDRGDRRDDDQAGDEGVFQPLAAVIVAHQPRQKVLRVLHCCCLPIWPSPTFPTNGPLVRRASSPPSSASEEAQLSAAQRGCCWNLLTTI